MDLINEKGETLLSICVETQGCFEMDPESGGPSGNCVFERLSQAGCNSASLASADERDVPSLEYIFRLVYPERDQQVINKMQPDCLKLSTIVQKCKFKISAIVARNVINRGGKNDPDTSFIHGKIGVVRKTVSRKHPTHSQTKRADVEKGVWPSGSEISRMDSPGGILKYGRIQHQMGRPV